jgi:hypothetical protein
LILAIGDSNVYPACTESDQPIDGNNMVPEFSRLMDQPFRCWGKNGASNYWIETHLEYFLADRSSFDRPFLLIGWTSFEREEWPWLYNNISVCGGPDFGMPEPMKAKFNQWKNKLNGDYYRDRAQFWHDCIYQIHLNLQKLDIPHLFWTTYINFKEIANQQDWHGSFFQPYEENGCMSRFLESQGVRSIENDPWHYGPEAHATWAQALYNYSQENTQ